MNTLYDIRSGKIIKSLLYNNGLNISDEISKEPILEADFTTGTYKAKGTAKSFEDLFTFNRAGKAWLVKETGLHEYAADIPRFDNGLLIEQSSTNLNMHSLDVSKLPKNGSGGDPIPSNIVAPDGNYAISLNKSGSLTVFSRSNLTGVVTTSIYTAGAGVLRIAGYPLPTYGGVDLNVAAKTYTLVSNGVGMASISTLNSEWLRLIYSTTGKDFSYIQAALQSIDRVNVWGAQTELSEHSTTLIPTTTSQVTRPADYLFNKITGTTVTGDWDSTLTLSIVAGQLVHTGYGRIRSLEIN